MCELEWTRSNYRAVLAASERLLAFMRNAGGRVAVPDALLFKGKALLALGQIDSAEETLRLAEAEATALGSVRSLWLVLPMLADVAMRRGQPEEAARLRARARDITRGLLDSLHQPELRSTFEKRLSEGGQW